MTDINIPSTDILYEELSSDAKRIVMSLGSNWRSMTGNNRSYVSFQLLLYLHKMNTRSWTVNQLHKLSGEGVAGIKYGFLDDFYKLHILLADTSGRYDRYYLSTAGAEVVKLMLLNCNRCDNTRICTECNGSGHSEEVCTHSTVPDKGEGGCEVCESTGFRKCYTCNSWNYRIHEDNKPGQCKHCVGKEMTSQIYNNELVMNDQQYDNERI